MSALGAQIPQFDLPCYDWPGQRFPSFVFRDLLEAKGQSLPSRKGNGLDQYEVKRRDGGYRHITLAMLAQAYLTEIRQQAME